MTAPTLQIDPNSLKRAAECLCAGELIILPTDTVYGLAAHVNQPEIALYEAKGRPADKPIPLLVADATVPSQMGAEFPPAAEALAKAFWPGPLTLVLRVNDRFEGFRVPDHADIRHLAQLCGGALRVTSANQSGEAPATTAEEALQPLAEHVSLALDGGPSPLGEASTVVKVSHEKLEVLREGAISIESVNATLLNGRDGETTRE